MQEIGNAEDKLPHLRDWEQTEIGDVNVVREAELIAKLAFVPYLEQKVWQTVEQLILRMALQGKNAGFHATICYIYVRLEWNLTNTNADHPRAQP